MRTMNEIHDMGNRIVLALAENAVSGVVEQEKDPRELVRKVIPAEMINPFDNLCRILDSNALAHAGLFGDHVCPWSYLAVAWAEYVMGEFEYTDLIFPLFVPANPVSDDEIILMHLGRAFVSQVLTPLGACDGTVGCYEAACVYFDHTQKEQVKQAVKATEKASN